MGGLSYRPALFTVLTGTMCFHAWPAVWRHGTGGLALEGGWEELNLALVATVAFVLQRIADISDYEVVW